MNDWVFSILWIGGIGAVCGTALAFASRYLTVEEDPRIEQVTNELPGANCGGCGFAGCADYARAMVTTSVTTALCPLCNSATLAKIAAIFGRTVEAVERKVARVHCGGSDSEALRRFAYNGIADCAAAAATGGGDKACAYGCLGYGSCVRVCPVGAIAISGGLASVNPATCISCGKCVPACPRGLITLVPAAAKIHVLCSSRDKGPVVKKVCGVGCIGCALCVKLSDGAIAMDGFLAKVDYSIPLTNDALVDKCPGHCILKIG
jgi:Na+-translocating ferredoxin:NAD+ oxidoreductase RNF subunit RnfB